MLLSLSCCSLACGALLADALHHSAPGRAQGAQRRADPFTQHDGVGGADNMCIEDHLVPELFLLGMPKTATSTLGFNLGDMGIESTAPGKESKFFDTLAMVSRGLTTPLEGEHRSKWLSIMPECNRSTRRVVADMTPEYLMLTPMPAEFLNPKDTRVQSFPGFDYFYGFPGQTDLPMVLSQLYGPEMSQRLRFVVTMREPLAQLVSSYFFLQTVFKWAVPTVKLAKADERRFESDLEQYLNKSLMTPQISQLLYARHTEWYLRYFQPRQFLMIPYRFVFHPDQTLRQRVYDSIFRAVGFAPTAPLPDVRKKIFSSGHMAESISPPIAARFREAMRPESERLVDVLAGMSTRGAALVLYGGTPGSKAETGAWLRSGW